MRDFKRREAGRRLGRPHDRIDQDSGWEYDFGRSATSRGQQHDHDLVGRPDPMDGDGLRSDGPAAFLGGAAGNRP